MMPLTSLLKNKLLLSKNYNVSHSDIDNLPYYIFEEYIKIVNELTEEESKDRKKQEDEQKAGMPNFNPSSYMKGVGSSLPKFK